MELLARVWHAHNAAGPGVSFANVAGCLCEEGGAPLLGMGWGGGGGTYSYPNKKVIAGA